MRIGAAIAVGVALAAACLWSGPPCRAAEWPTPRWTAERALAVPVAQFTVDRVSLQTALDLLDNRAGLQFGYMDLSDRPPPASDLTLSVTNTTVGDIVAALAARCPDFRLSTVAGTPVFVRSDASGRPPALAKTRVPRLCAGDLPLPDFDRLLAAAVMALPGAPPLYQMVHYTIGMGGVPRVTLNLGEVPTLELLSRAARVTCRSWCWMHYGTDGAATLAMGEGWGLPMGLKATVELSPEADREVIASAPPPREVVRARVEAVLQNARLRAHGVYDAVGELSAVTGNSGTEQTEATRLAAVELLGQIKTEWSAAPWSNELALSVPVAELSAHDAPVLTVLQELDDQCGLCFGYMDVSDNLEKPPGVTLQMRDVTVGAILTALAAQCPGYAARTIRGIPVFARQDGSGGPPALLDAPAADLVVEGASAAELDRRLCDALALAPGAPPMYRLSPDKQGTGSGAGVTLKATGLTVGDLLCEAAVAGGRSWCWRYDGDRLWAEPVAARVWASGPDPCLTLRRGERPEGATPEGIVLRARLAAHVASDAMGELIGLMDDPRAWEGSGGRLGEGIELIGQAGAREGAWVLARGIALRGQSLSQLRKSMAAVPPGDPDPATWGARVYGALMSTPSVLALVQIGRPAVEAVTYELRRLQIEPVPGVREMKSAPDEREGAVVQLCEVLSRILGAEGAVAHLREAADGEGDSARSKRLRDAADRIERGLIPTP